MFSSLLQLGSSPSNFFIPSLQFIPIAVKLTNFCTLNPVN